MVQEEAKKRILSIDALRGFDMMWIAGVDKFLIGVGAALNTEFAAAIDQLDAAM